MPQPASGLGERGRRIGAESAVADNRRALDLASSSVEAAALRLREADARRDSIEVELRELRRRREQALETERRAVWLIEQRSKHGSAPQDARRAELTGEINAERRLVERIEGELRERERQRERLVELIARDEALAPRARRVIAALEHALGIVRERRDQLEGRAVRRRSARPAGCRAAARAGAARVRAAGQAARRRRDADAAGGAPGADPRSRAGRDGRAGPHRRGARHRACGGRRAAGRRARARRSTRSSSGSSAGASASARSTRWPSRSTSKRSRTSKSWRSSARTPSPRSPSYRA